MERAAIDWKLKDDIEPIPLTDSFYYLLMYGGYIKPEYLLTDEDLNMSYDDVINCEDRKMGHAFVLAMLLEDPEEVEKYCD